MSPQRTFDQPSPTDRLPVPSQRKPRNSHSGRNVKGIGLYTTLHVPMEDSEPLNDPSNWRKWCSPNENLLLKGSYNPVSREFTASTECMSGGPALGFGISSSRGIRKKNTPADPFLASTSKDLLRYSSQISTRPPSVPRAAPAPTPPPLTTTTQDFPIMSATRSTPSSLTTYLRHTLPTALPTLRATHYEYTTTLTHLLSTLSPNFADIASFLRSFADLVEHYLSTVCEYTFGARAGNFADVVRGCLVRDAEKLKGEIRGLWEGLEERGRGGVGHGTVSGGWRRVCEVLERGVEMLDQEKVGAIGQLKQ